MRKLSAVFLFCFIPVFLFAQADKDPVSPIISIEIIGLKRTKPRVTDYALEKFIGRDAETLNTNDVTAAILDTGVLEPVSVEILPAENGVILQVTVAEKWSIFPLPLVLINSSGTSFGLFLADTNAFGLKDQIVLGGMYSPESWTGMIMYRDAPDKKGSPGWNTSFMYNSRTQEDSDETGETLREYEAVMLRGSLGLEYPVVEHLTLSFGVSYADTSITNDMYNAPKEGNRSIGFSPGLSLRYSNWDGYLLTERQLSLSYTYNLALQGNSIHEIGMRGGYAFSIVPGFVFSLKGGILFNSGNDALFEKTPQHVQIDILPGKFSALHYGGAQAGLEKHLFKSRIGTLSVLASWQAVLAGGSSGNTFAHGPAGGIRFYLSRIAIPALGFVMAYNMNTSLPQFSFSIGMGF